MSFTFVEYNLNLHRWYGKIPATRLFREVRRLIQEPGTDVKHRALIASGYRDGRRVGSAEKSE